MDRRLQLIYILCGNAAYNRGDRGNLFAQLRLLREAFPSVEIVLDSYRPDIDRQWYNATVIKRGLFLTSQQWRYLKQADVIIWGGGALIADNSCRTIILYWLIVITLIKKILRKPVMAWAQGLVITTKLGAILGRLTLNQVDLITVRDRDSYHTLKRIKATKPPHHTTADPAILIRPSSPATGKKLLRAAGVPLNDDKKLIALSPTFWPFYHDKNDIIPFMFARQLGLRQNRHKQRVNQFKADLVRLIDAVIERHQAAVILMPRYPSLLWDDINHLEQVRRQSRHQSHVYIYPGDDYPPQDYLAMWHVFDLVISIALHDTLFALALNRPCVQLYYEAKGKDLAARLKAGQYMRDWSILSAPNASDQVLRLTNYALRHLPDRKYRQIKNQLQQEASMNIFYLRRLLEQKDIIATK